MCTAASPERVGNPRFVSEVASYDVASNICQVLDSGDSGGERWEAGRCNQGLTLVHFSAQLEPCLTHKTTLHAINTP